MQTALIVIGAYLVIPAIGLWISGRSITWRGALVFFLLWPIGWLIFPPEELP